MKILLISPFDNKIWSLGELKFPPLGLAVLASLTPDEINVEIIDESVRSITDYTDDIDLVAISVMTPLAPRAYELADFYRKLGVKVILGGWHPTLIPEEALKHADSVMIGEAEYTWPKMIVDLKQNKLKKIYRNEGKINLENLPIPRRDLYTKRKYLLKNTVQISRGCPFACEFCSVPTFYGNEYNFRPINEVVNEIKSMRGDIFFVDDNIIGNKKYAVELFKAIKKLNINWVGQSTITVAKDDNLLKLIAESGCKGLFIGFESLSDKNLKVSGKLHNNVEKYEEYITRIHNHGIGIHGAFIFGFDDDDINVFENVVNFSKQNGLETCQFTILTPYPGTALYYKLNSEGRILHTDWSKYDCSNVVFQPKNMTVEELQNGFEMAYRKFYSYNSIFTRLLKSRRYLRLYLPINIGFKKLTNSLIRRNLNE